MIKELHFIYQDAKGNLTARSVSVLSETEEHIQAICRSVNAIRTFLKDRIIEKIDLNEFDDIKSISIRLNERLNYYLENPPPKPIIPQRKKVKYIRKDINEIKHPKKKSLEVCFTGFAKVDKTELISLAKAKKLIVRDNVTEWLDILCCGYNAGKNKIVNARHQNVFIMNEKQFRQMLETGEIPSEWLINKDK
jgi:hypothetical protein